MKVYRFHGCNMEGVLFIFKIIQNYIRFMIVTACLMVFGTV